MKEVEHKSVRLFKVLGNPLRRKILGVLLQAPAHPEEIARRTGRILTAVSRALGILASADLVAYRTQGHGVLYFIKRPDIESLLNLSEIFVRKSATALRPYTMPRIGG
jgi:predicted transcriptional regulator